MMFFGCSGNNQDVSEQNNTAENSIINEGAERIDFDTEKLESLLQQSIMAQQETGAILAEKMDNLLTLSQTTNAFMQKLLEAITGIQNTEEVDLTPIIKLIEQFQVEFEQKTDDVTAIIKDSAERQVVYYDTTNHNYYNTYLDAIASPTDAKDGTPETEKDQDDKKDIGEDEDEKEPLIPTDETCYTTGSSIAFDATEGTTYVYLLNLYTEPLNINFGVETDINTISVELYEDNQTNTVFLCQEGNSVYVEDELDGTYYLVLKGMPAGPHMIEIGF